MKKLFYILFAASAVLFVSCAKELGDNKTATDAKLTGETITFSATIDMPAATRAALSGLNINWQSGDYIAFATDNDATIRVYPVTVDGVDPTKCTITVDKVDGASGYYAIFKGSLGDGGAGVNDVDADDYSMVTFNTTTKTFSGLTVGNQQVAENSLSSHLWYTNGYPLAMAGKADGSSLSMKPCLALVKLQIDAESVPAGYYYTTDTYTSSYSINHDHNYSAVRGFNLYQIGGSTIYSSGDYDVQIAADGSLTTTATSDKQYRQISQKAKLVAGTNYLMCLIPGGSISSFKVDFLGYKDNTPTLSWDAVYTMRLSTASTVSPGDYYDLGVLNPLGRKKAKNEAEDEAADAITPVITIDGNMSDWNPATNAMLTASNYASATGNSYFKEIKVAYDEMYLYVYIKRNRIYTLWGTNQAYYYMFFDTDNDSSNGVAKDGANYDYGLYFYPFAGTKGANEAEAKPGFNASPTTSVASGFSLGGGISLSCAGKFDETDVEIEVVMPRSSLGIDKNDVINIAAYGNKSADSSPYTKITAFEIVN